MIFKKVYIPVVKLTRHFYFFGVKKIKIDKKYYKIVFLLLVINGNR